MKNKIISIILVLFLSLPAVVYAVNEALPAQEEQVVAEDVVGTPQMLDEDIPAELEMQDSKSATPYKSPISKRKLLKKFLLAMVSVAVSSFVLFFGLTLYNRIRNTILNEVRTPDGETSLESPDDLTDAVNKFLEKTSWK